MAKSNESLSLNETVKMYGVEIRKMPCGKYFEALQTLKNLPEDFIKELSDNKEDFKLSEMLSLDNLINLITKLLMIAPKFLFSFLSKLLDVEEDYIENKLSPTELTEICIKFWEINKLESFFALMKPAIKNLMTLTGFKK
mgnify:CR=1 FL=1